MKRKHDERFRTCRVAPRAGARIETLSRVRYVRSCGVAPRAGARIETILGILTGETGGCRPPCGGAD